MPFKSIDADAIATFGCMLPSVASQYLVRVPHHTEVHS